MDSEEMPQATVVDLLDRVLDRGLVINADIIITLAGIPLIGINLRAALAGMETMLKYGVMEDWDKSIRSREPCRLGTTVHLTPEPMGNGILDIPSIKGGND